MPSDPLQYISLSISFLHSPMPLRSMQKEVVLIKQNLNLDKNEDMYVVRDPSGMNVRPEQ